MNTYLGIQRYSYDTALFVRRNRTITINFKSRDDATAKRRFKRLSSEERSKGNAVGILESRLYRVDEEIDLE